MTPKKEQPSKHNKRHPIGGESTDLNALNENGEAALSIAAADGDLKKIETLLDLGADVNVRDSIGCTPLHAAATYNRVDVMKALLDKGADIDAVNIDGDTVLHYAAGEGSLDAVKFLLKKGIKPDVVNNHGDAPLHSAAHNNHLNNDGFAVFELLCKKCPQALHAKNNAGNSALHYAANAIYKDNTAIINYLIKHGLDPNAKNLAGNTPLHFAGKASAVDSLLAAGANHDVRGKDGNTPLHYIVQLTKDRVLRSDAVRALLKHGAAVNCRNDKGETPYDLAGASIMKSMLIHQGGAYVKGAEQPTKDELNAMHPDLKRSYTLAKRTGGMSSPDGNTRGR